LKTDNQNNVQERNRWLRVGLLIFTLIGPIVNTIVERMRQRSQSLQNTAPKKLKISQAAARQRIEELTQASRQLAVERAQILQEQANQLQAQAQHLRKALSENARQSRKVAEQFRKTSSELSSKLRSSLQRNAVERVQILRGSELLTEELTERGNQLVERGSQVTQDLTKRGKKIAHELAERSEGLLEPVRQRNGTFWTVLGFSIGLIAALVATYVFVRQRLLKPATDPDEQIELPQNGYRTQTTTAAEPSAQPTKVE
jgi:flagellar basal body-associated protein FliL